MDAYTAGLTDNYGAFLTIRSQTLIDAAKTLTDEVEKIEDIVPEVEEVEVAEITEGIFDDEGVDDSEITDEDE